MAGLDTRFFMALEKAAGSAFTPSGESSYFDESVSRLAEIRQLLGSKFDQERVEGMKYLIAVRATERPNGWGTNL
jgi:hypothetical protein